MTEDTYLGLLRGGVGRHVECLGEGDELPALVQRPAQPLHAADVQAQAVRQLDGVHKYIITHYKFNVNCSGTYS